MLGYLGLLVEVECLKINSKQLDVIHLHGVSFVVQCGRSSGTGLTFGSLAGSAGSSGFSAGGSADTGFGGLAGNVSGSGNQGSL